MNKKINATILLVLAIVIGVLYYISSQGLIDMNSINRNVDENDITPTEVIEPVIDTTIETEIDTMTSFTLGQTNFEPLTVGHYEGWIISGAEKISIGKFNINSQGEFINLDGSVIPGNTLQVNANGMVIEKIAITIEPQDDADSVPSNVVAAEIASGAGGRLLFSAVDLSTANGQYILGTPSDDPAGNENSGLWFAIPGNPPAASLNLPALSDGWVYEGWAVYEGNALTTGRFAIANSGDNFSGYNAAGNIPNLPGEDFLQNLPNGLVAPINLANGTSQAVVSLEPDINGIDPTGDSPFQIKFLVANIPSGLIDHSVTNMTVDTSSAPFIDISVK